MQHGANGPYWSQTPRSLLFSPSGASGYQWFAGSDVTNNLYGHSFDEINKNTLSWINERTARVSSFLSETSFMDDVNNILADIDKLVQQTLSKMDNCMNEMFQTFEVIADSLNDEEMLEKLTRSIDRQRAL